MSDFAILYCPQLSPQNLSAGAAAYTGLRDPGLWQTAREPDGKPYFPRMPQVHFSITHSGGCWLCAFGPEPVGLDLQRHEDCRRQNISRRFFHPQEDAFLVQNGYRDFFQVWSAKESYLKFTGRGMLDGLDGFAVAGPQGLLSRVEGVQLRPLPFLPGYSLCLCAREIGSVTLLGPWPGGPVA